jgi:hypothetical protein
MALEEFENDKLSEREKGIVRMRSVSNYVMGIMIIAAGVLFLFPPEIMKERLSLYDPAMIKIMAVVCFIYGAFRVYRGYRKNYFRES